MPATPKFAHVWMLPVVWAVHLPLLDHVHGLDSGDEDSSTPKGLESEHGSGDPFDGPMVLFDDVVQVFGLAHDDVNTGTPLDTFDGGRIGAALVHGDLLGHIVQVDGTLQETSGCSQIALGSEQEVHRITVAIDGAAEVLPLTRNFDTGLIHAPA